ncbi:disulfide bond formation protein B [Sporosarcina sp. P12(2017)]|uniref:disulfide oxidoreductase n=1 Tax=unclassified Sporosarcina TaxID=2647733 RepID=UPI000C167E38|nr:MULTISPECIES: disulfide oxidoreductase [unclassified Sporosarcina]PIC56700.1 disulfide bond formation protein B [Sporosarcina sp. P10]PIC59917.1 disulfide bond formation protein B [Sporosarcina sp. P12(2017)]
MEYKESQSKTQGYLLYVAWVVSLVAMFGSLYFSEVKGYIPCELCWYQRILMYPLTLLLGIATFQNDTTVKKFVLPLALIGGSISFMHYLEQKIPGFGGIKPCVSGVPCNAEYINWFGFVTIPFLALMAFVIIAVCMFLIKPKKLIK